MDMMWISIFLAVAMLVLLSLGVWVSFTLIAIGGLGLILSENYQVDLLFATSSWGASTAWSLTALPLFIWMGEVLFRTRLSEDLFKGLSPWLGNVPGKLLHVNILSCGIFAAVSGSSAATAATIGRMTLPELRKQGYSDRMAIGTLAGSGTLGLLIPPSIILIVYGVAAEVSIARLFIAGALPGLLLVSLFMGFTMIWGHLHKDELPKTTGHETSWSARIKGLRKLLPVVGLIGFVLGSIYGGITTPTEAAAIGVTGALILAACTGSLSRHSFMESLLGAVKSSCMIGFILVGAHFLTLAMGFLGIPKALAVWIAGMSLSPMELILYLTVLFVILGCFLDGISVVVLTVAVILPMVQAANIDLLWFGIFIVLVVEMSQITPPVGFNLFVIQALTGKNILYVAKAALPFFLLIGVAILLISIFPEIVTYLPTTMSQN
ncbi:C4-dicarboxylate ABC transporter permease [Marinomonas primoryensis]|jgi:tripartite ATP-independent transporter DctM subunit|uniref:TRAP transporter large permease protein n=1 Tax=Marinomonas primoryensis TaxID=178399 RepID=A0A2Z4PNR9_9GAMM|nr:TRAP transporter large permease subunit [Marinomonas primoryensis]AWX99102.1 C4-dicarboxylate ABC transporter permease [Marinomonas primoryensis]QKK78984.1 TRAP-type C4-dicarboxylate transport system large permease protein DctM [Marinomonas primoryensis]|tara:strand:+ start:17755 stop:19062 length:1308 start_codon:yes stop_codon:yes gene_type:complete